MLTAPHALAAQSGLGVLMDGGNAADAIIAVAASLAVLYPHMTGIGGDVFFLYYDAGRGEVVSYNGSGAAAAAATIEHYQERTLDAIPERGGAAVLTAPGAVDSWFALHERFGSIDMARILAPAIAFAHDGAPAARSFVAAVARLRDLLAADEGAADLYVEHGPRRVGERFVNRQLAATLRAIAQHGRAWLYEGEGAQHIERYCKRVSSPLRAADLAEHRGFFTTPAAGTFYGSTSITAPPNSQGIAALIAQQTYEAYASLPIHGSLADGSAARAHAGIEAIRLAFADRDACVGDPREPLSWERLLAGEHARALAQRIDPNASFVQSESGVDRGDTSYFACVDAAGNAVSFIQSLFHSFGAGVVVPELGFPLQNRGTAFELSLGRLRSLAPGKRPFHTLMPCMLLREKRPWLVYGSMGGEGQPQTALQISTRVACDEMDLQGAVEAPRWRYGKDPTDECARVRIEARLGAECVTGLRARGHIVEVVDDWDESMGHAGAIAIDRAQGLVTGAADPRGDGAALGV